MVGTKDKIVNKEKVCSDSIYRKFQTYAKRHNNIDTPNRCCPARLLFIFNKWINLV